ncbi:hypothetical protein DFH08DRAFT_939588 [Mycena albidolilacea]|uniref:Uncharacterized protein n=1 Tax=Mycena albidolilacea TaxID=1033008 RepID=A0AAD6ZR17_9AGAR|nr:hypothetical protein DFH08DRAFT_939588 [Mycena albidolilacea]
MQQRQRHPSNRKDVRESYTARKNLVTHTQRKPLKTAPPLPPHHFTRSACRPHAQCSAGSAASTIVSACMWDELVDWFSLIVPTAAATTTLDEKDNEGEMDTFPEAFENIVRVDVAHDAEAVGSVHFLVTKAAALARSLMDVNGAVLTFDGAAPRQLMAVAGAVLIALDGAPLLMAGVGRDEQIKAHDPIAISQDPRQILE